MQPNQQNPYDFIMAPTPKKRGFGAGSQKTRIIQVAVIGLIALIVAVVVMQLISSGNKGKTDTLVSLAASQQDIIDITKAGATELRDQQLLIKSASAGLLVTSQYNQTIDNLKALGNKNPSKQIASQQVKTYTKTLTEAKQNGNYDTVYLALLTNRIDEYRVRLQAAYTSAASSELQKEVSNQFQQIETLFPATTNAN